MQDISLTASLTFFKPSSMGAAVGRSVVDFKQDVSGRFFVEGTISIDVSATPIPLGNVSAPHWAFFRNIDPINFITLRNGSTGADFAQLYAGESAFVPLIFTCTPYALANTAASLLEYLIVSL